MAGRKPRIVVDTNVLVSSLWGGKPGAIVDLWKEGRVILLVSFPILKEYLAVLARFGLSDEQLKERGLLFLDSPFSAFVHPSRHFEAIPEDPADECFLDCAVEGKASAIVSGDRHLLRQKVFHRIPILTPAEFLRGRIKH